MDNDMNMDINSSDGNDDVKVLKLKLALLEVPANFGRFL
jgi:hypothetical protein